MAFGGLPGSVFNSFPRTLNGAGLSPALGIGVTVRGPLIYSPH